VVMNPFLLFIFINLLFVNGELSLAESLDIALKYFSDNDLKTSKQYLQQALQISPSNPDANGFLGSIYIFESDLLNGIHYLEISLKSDGFSNPENIANYLHGLFSVGDYSKALSIFQQTLPKHPTNLRILFNGLLIYSHLNFLDEMDECAMKYLGNQLDRWLDILSRMNEKRYHYLVERFVGQALSIFGTDQPELFFQLALSLHFQNKLPEALSTYERVLEIQPNHSVTISNIGAIYQSAGKNDEAMAFYRRYAFGEFLDDPGILNNFGVLLLHSTQEEDLQDGVRMLERALEINPSLENALVNLASFYLDDGLIGEAEALYRRALVVSGSPKLIEIRLATLTSPVVSSWSQMLKERQTMVTRLEQLLLQGPPPDKLYRELDQILDRIHFYIVYSGLNDRHIQEAISTIYQTFIRNISKISPSLTTSHPATPPASLSAASPPTRIKVGFVSKYFAVYEPHGLLLEGVMKYLPRSLFEIYAITTAPNVGKFLSPVIVKSSDHIIFIPLFHLYAFQQISDLQLDILIFGDTLSEPTTHFLAQSRMAPIQAAFWGNPVTSGSPFIDYFISSDFMEHPYRTRLLDNDEPYHEQVVLLPGQGIWYTAPDSDDSKVVIQYLNLSHAPHEETFQRKDFFLEDDWFIFFCPQSLFKLHPLFDEVMSQILQQSPQSHLVLTNGRKQRWTSIFSNRLSKTLRPYASRCHMLDRITAQKFVALIKLADVLLHPFPFDGSRTSADSLSVGIPYVTLPSEYLRGRMGASLLRTMNIPELVAHNVSEYVQISVRLSIDQPFYSYIKSLIASRSWLIWNDMTCPFEWTRFLALSTGLPPPSWEEYLSSVNSNLNQETKFRSIRENNQRTFDLRWGKEIWLLETDGVPHLPELVNENEIPPIFTNWKKSSLINSETSVIQNRNSLIAVAHEHAFSGLAPPSSPFFFVS
jgi:predicted O-linked N-acetylglucosamine transferase (SPINDLY family)